MDTPPLVMSMEELRRLDRYQCSMPTNPSVGRRWRWAHVRNGRTWAWYVAEVVIEDGQRVARWSPVDLIDGHPVDV